MGSTFPLQLPQGPEWIVIIIVVLVLLFGATKIPQLAKSLGRATGEFRKGKQEVERELREAAKPAKPEAEETQREKLERAARDLGIDPAGKSDDELKREIEKALLR